MANFGPAHAFILVGGRNVTPDHYTLYETNEQILEQTNSLGDTWEEHLPVGIGKVGLEAAGGLYDNTVDRLMTAFQEKGATLQIVDYGFEGATTGTEGILLNGDYAASWKRIAERSGLTKAHALHTITGARKSGTVLHGISAETASSGTSAWYNHGSVTTGDIAGHLQLVALTLGSAVSFTVTILDSSDNGTTITARLTFTATTSAPNAYEQTATTGTKQYTAMRWVFNASTSGAPTGTTATPYVSIYRA